MGIPAGNGVDAAGTPNLGDQANAVLSGQITAVGPTAPFAFRGPLNLAIYASVNTSLTTTIGSLSATLGAATGLANGDAINSVNVPPGTTFEAISGTTVTLVLSPVTIWGTILSNGQVTLLPATGASFAAQLLGATITIPTNLYGATLPSGTTVTAILQTDVPATSLSPGTPAIIQLSNGPSNLPTTQRPSGIPFQFAPTGNAITVTGTDAKAIFTGAAVDYSATIQLERSFDGGNTWIVCNIGSTGTLAQWNTGTPVSLAFGEPEKNVLYRLNCTAYTSGTINYRFSQTGGAAESLAIGPLTGG